MYVTVTSLIQRAKAYVDDGSAADQGWIPDSTWEYWLTVEYHTVIQRLLSDGLIGPQFVDETITATGADSYELLTRVMAIASVREVDSAGQSLRMLTPLQPSEGRFDTAPRESLGGGYGSCRWAAHATYGATGATQSNVTLQLQPTPASGSYVVRVVPEPPSLVATLSVGTPNPVPNAPTEATAVNLPAPAMDLLVLGAANRALIKGGAASGALYGLIKRTEDDLAHMSHGRILGLTPLVRDTNDRMGRNQMTSPGLWWWI